MRVVTTPINGRRSQRNHPKILSGAQRAGRTSYKRLHPAKRTEVATVIRIGL